MPNGYHGKILVVDLTNRAITIDEHDEQWYRTYMGGTNFRHVLHPQAHARRAPTRWGRTMC